MSPSEPDLSDMLDTPVIPNNLPPDFRKWKRGNVKSYLEANLDECGIEQNIIDLVFQNYLSGRHFLNMTAEELRTIFKLPAGAARGIQELIDALVNPQGQLLLPLYNGFSRYFQALGESPNKRVRLELDYSTSATIDPANRAIPDVPKCR
ncbi:hypothetical protein L211DRAFT_889958 [Terfezia boudieri ATCC MYA-4762]|uniref:Uncharacterized protein n=1 Tax=Terfezia boudieri ATCC MYA-4762 TaxID=1051890 RepID=A0A3N4LEA7_9PEZI|nr:hypothetical protein L211DRAFT_889958 [Terfezia boudieri ATCC MYA-4762]